MAIREERPADGPAVRHVVEAAFGRPAEADLVEKLRANGKVTLALVAEEHGQIVGHILFSPVTIEANAELIQVAGLAPLAVLPESQRSGVGSLLVRAGLAQCQAAGFDAAIVLGHPEYYPRFGFVPASRFGLHSEYAVRDEVFMALELRPGTLSGCSGLAKYQAEFNEV